MRLLGLAGACLALFCLLAPLAGAAGGEGLITAAEARKMLGADGNSMTVLDVRTPAEYAAGHIKGAVNIDFFGPRFEMELGRLDKSKPVLIYCQTGRRSEAAAKMTRSAGFQEVHDLKGGVKAWRAAGLPLEEGAARR